MKWHQEESSSLLQRDGIHPSVQPVSVEYREAAYFTFLCLYLPFFGIGDNQAIICARGAARRMVCGKQERWPPQKYPQNK